MILRFVFGERKWGGMSAFVCFSIVGDTVARFFSILGIGVVWPSVGYGPTIMSQQVGDKWRTPSRSGLFYLIAGYNIGERFRK
jgi:hypothetical protein